MRMNEQEEAKLMSRTQRALNDLNRCYVCATIKEGNTTHDGKCKVCAKRRIVEKGRRKAPL